MGSNAPPPYHEAKDYDTTPTVTVSQPQGYSGEGSDISSINEFPARGTGLSDKCKRIGDRLIIDFEKISCCPWETVGLDHDCRNNVPGALRDKGISQSMWAKWCDDLMKAQKMAPSITGCLCVFCFPGFLAQSILCAMCCPTSADHCLTWLPCCYGNWFVALDKWQRKVNKELNRKDMHAKLKTYKPFQK